NSVLHLVRFNNSYGIRHFCDEQALNSLHFLTGASAGFLRTLAASRPPRYATTRGPCSITSGTRTSSTRSDTPKWRPTDSRSFGGTDDGGAGSIAPARKILPFEEDDAPYRRDHSPAGGRTLRGMRSLGPTAVSASSISRFLGLGACAVAAAGSIV